MPPKTAEAKEATEDIYREPESDSSSDELSSKAVNIVNTVFTTAPLQTKTGIKSEIRKSTRASTTRSTRATHNSQLSSGRGADTNKRKTQEDADELGSSIRDKMEFQGTARRTIKRTKKYGETPKGSISLCSKAPAMVSTAKAKTLILHDTYMSSDDETPPFRDKSTPKKKLKLPQMDSSPEKTSDLKKSKFIIHETSDSEDNLVKESINISKFKLPLGDPISPLNHQKSLRKETSSPQSPIKPHDLIKNFKLPAGLSEMLSEDIYRDRTQSPIEEDIVLPPHLGRCPMCNTPIDKQVLKSQGFMNIRQQERFCNSHQKDTALNEWSDKGYPQIDWDSLDARIAQHHKFIEGLIRGQDSHYRAILDDIVEAGTERNLLKTTGNLTPGYYGSRGLRIISEHIMLKFTKLLKERAVKDKVIMARSVSAFLQMVLVPEVTTLLIMEDLRITENEARLVLMESARLGDFVHEEIQDVVVRQKEDDSDGGEASYDAMDD